MRILQVEDNKTNQKVVERIAKTDGHTVISVSNGREALAILAIETFDAIVMDRHMPIMDGLTATKKIREMDGSAASLPIIGITAGALEMELAACLDVGMDVVLTKPVDDVRFLETLAKYADREKSNSLPQNSAPILIIDDVVVNLAVAKKQLAKLGFTTETTTDPFEGFEMLKSGRYPVALVDIEMPKLDGVALTRALRNWEGESGAFIPVIAMTGHVDSDQHATFSDAGMNRVLTKPLDIDVLGETIRHWLPQHVPLKENVTVN